jgi:hypothetical protein
MSLAVSVDGRAGLGNMLLPERYPTLVGSVFPKLSIIYREAVSASAHNPRSACPGIQRFSYLIDEREKKL